MFKKLVFSTLCAVFFVACQQNDDKYDFRLNSEFGEVGLKNFASKRLIIYFGYTYCPDVCPATLALLSAELCKMRQDNAYLLFVSLDPLRDSDLNATNEWLRYFYPHSTALIAKDETHLAEVARNFGVIYEKVPLPNSAMSYSVAHSNEIFLFKDGKFYGKINDLSAKNLHEKLAEFLEK